MEDKYLPIFVITGVFGAIFAFGPLFVRKGPNRGIIRACIMMSAFSIWIFWVTAYIAQMNPLAGPRLHNTTLAWIQYAFGTRVAGPRLRGIRMPAPGDDIFGPDGLNKAPIIEEDRPQEMEPIDVPDELPDEIPDEMIK